MIPVSLLHYLILAAVLFVLGLIGVFINRRNFIVVLMSIELILLAVGINFVVFSAMFADISGQIFTLFILAVAAAEAAVGLALVTVFFRITGSINVDDIRSMKH